MISAETTQDLQRLTDVHAPTHVCLLEIPSGHISAKGRKRFTPPTDRIAHRNGFTPAGGFFYFDSP